MKKRLCKHCKDEIKAVDDRRYYKFKCKCVSMWFPYGANACQNYDRKTLHFWAAK